MIKGKLLSYWYGLSLKRKLYALMVGVTLFMAAAIIVNIKLSYMFINDVSHLMDDNLSSYQFGESFNNEVTTFTNLIRDWTPENEEKFQTASKETENYLLAMPQRYEQVGEQRFAVIWNIKNGYGEYQKQRDRTIELRRSGQSYITDLYKSYQMQEYLKTYISRLTKEVFDESNDYYAQRVQLLQKMPYILLTVCILSLGALFFLIKKMMTSLIRIVFRLVEATSGIEKNDFTVPDVFWPGTDEIGQLVSAFNKMKHAMQRYVHTLEEKRMIEEQLHEQELERANLEQRFSLAQLQLLKSQLNPHFLFNTLNMITRMAQLEEAPVTEEMLVAMSNLLRYSLRTTEPFAPLNQELKIVEDYMYIQKKRFGERVSWDIACDIKTEQLEVPVFLLQPLVENAVIHGISRKENGGHIQIGIQSHNGILHISVADNGVGMSEERLSQIRNAIKSRGSGLGIGLGNIYRRIAAYYEQGEVVVESRAGSGTRVLMSFGARKQ